VQQVARQQHQWLPGAWVHCRCHVCQIFTDDGLRAHQDCTEHRDPVVPHDMRSCRARSIPLALLCTPDDWLACRCASGMICQCSCTLSRWQHQHQATSRQDHITSRQRYISSSIADNERSYKLMWQWCMCGRPGIVRDLPVGSLCCAPKFLGCSHTVHRNIRSQFFVV
jgi:hypothetical protein